MRLRLTVEGQASDRAEITLFAEPDTPTGEALSEISRATSSIEPLWDSRGPVPTDGLLSTSGLSDGTILRSGATARALRDGAASGIELRVVGGPRAGAVHRLRPGRVVIGRHSSCAVTLLDPEISREHAAIEIAPDSGEMTLVDLGSSNGTLLEGAIVGQVPVPLLPGQVVQVGASFVTIQPIDPIDADLSDDGHCGFVFNRHYRILRPSPEVEIAFPAAPDEEDKPGFPWIMTAAPLVVAVAMAAILRRPEYLLLAVMSPVMTIGSTVHDRQGRRKRQRKAAADFERQTREATERWEGATLAERARRREEAPDPATVLLTAAGPRGRLWERRPTDHDHLRLRVGLASQPSVVRTVNHLSPPPAWAVPVAVPLPAVGVLGVSAPLEVARGLARWLALQTAVLHGPDDARLVVMTEDSAAPDWEWVRWLPHLETDPTEGVLAIGNNAATVAARATELQRLITTRLEHGATRNSMENRQLPEVVVVIDGAKRLRSLPGMMAILRDGPRAGVYSICLDVDRSLLPEECGSVVAWDAASGTAILEQHGSDPVNEVAVDQLDALLGETAARSVAPIHRLGGGEEQTLSGGARFLELAELEPPTESDVRRCWSSPDRGPRALIGVADHGPLILDLATDGPHGLVAGTTGSGKSELLQTLVAGLAAWSPCDELNVVLVDYKGGAAFRELDRLPHTVGFVTDLDAHLTERALRSLRAELKWREGVLSAATVKDIDDYTDARRAAGSALPPLPRLVIVIDEFASLAEELPELMKGLIGIAQRGRSLGVHLVLATQRPGRAVSPEIRANANFAVALRVVNSAESSDVIGTGDAADISPATPGRAYLRISQEPPVRFQTARIGGRRPGASAPAPPVRAVLRPWQDLGRLQRAAAPQGPPPPPEATDLHALVESIRQAASGRESGLRRPWLDPLPEVVTLQDLRDWETVATEPVVDGNGPAAGRPEARSTGTVPFGLLDLPDAQTQRPAYFDPGSGHHLLVAGSPRSGRSSFLRTLAAALADDHGVDDLHLYGVDCGNGGILALRDLPHCGAVVTRTETDRAERLFSRLAGEVRRRQSRLVELGMSNVREQRTTDRHGVALDDDAPWPLMVLLVDSWEGFYDAFHDHKEGTVEQTLLGLLRDGGPIGLSVVTTGDRSLLSTTRVASLFQERLVLRFNDRDDYSLANLSPRKMPETVPDGRAFGAVSGDEIQIALLASDPSGAAQTAALAAIVAHAKTATGRAPARGHARPMRVDALPSRIGLSAALRLDSPAPDLGEPPPIIGDRTSPLSILAGVGGDELAPRWVDLAVHGPGLAVTGSPESGKSTALLSAGLVLLSQGCRVLALCPRGGPLAELDGHPEATVLRGPTGAAAGKAAVDDLMGGSGPDGDVAPLAVLVDDAELLDPDEPWLTELAASHPGSRAVVVAGALEPLRDAFRGFQLYVKRSGCGLLLSPKSHLDAGTFGGVLPRGAGFAGPPGRGYLFVRGRLDALVQVPAPDGAVTTPVDAGL